jgi:hypothetical protein
MKKPGGGGGWRVSGGFVFAGNIPAKSMIKLKYDKAKVIDNEPFFTFYFII